MKTKTKRMVCLISALLLISNVQYGQKYFHSLDGARVFFDTPNDSVQVSYALQSDEDINKLSQTIGEGVAELKREGVLTVESRTKAVELLYAMNEASVKEPDYWVISPIVYRNGTRFETSERFIVELSDFSQYEKLIQTNLAHGVKIVNGDAATSNRFTLRYTGSTGIDIFEIANLYFRELDLLYSIPALKGGLVRNTNYKATDTYRYLQYQLDIIKADQAWNISRSNSEIIIAVVDDGVEIHPDLPSNRIVTGINAFNLANNDGTPDENFAHGMMCAGIIASTHNDIGTSGLAPNVKIMPVKIFNAAGNAPFDDKIAAAIDTAVARGASIISNSWSSKDVSDTTSRGLITNAFNRAIDAGVIVVSSTGNNSDNNKARFPSTISRVIAVGAVDKNGVHWNYSNADISIDLVAPSGDIGSEDGQPFPCSEVKAKDFTLHGDVWTIDQSGLPGIEPGDHNFGVPACWDSYTKVSNPSHPSPTNDYVGHFGGTSAAAPLVSATVALMLDVNPSLNPSEATLILRNSADHLAGMGSNSFTKKYGYGRLNAFEAVKQSMPTQWPNKYISWYQSLNNWGHMYGYSTLASSGSINVSSTGHLVIDGILNGSGGNDLSVHGEVIILEHAQVSNLNIVVYNNGNLRVLPGAVLDGVSINVQSGGELIMDDVTATFSGSQGFYATGKVTVTNSTFDWEGALKWDGIQLSGAGANGSVLENVTVRNADYGLRLTNSSNIDIDNLISSSNTYGIRLDNTSGVTISNSLVDVTTYGLQVINSSGVTLENVENWYSTYNAAYVSNSSVTVKGNSTFGYSDDGLEIANSSDVFITSPMVAPYLEPFQFVNNSASGIYVRSSSNVDIGNSSTGGYCVVQDNAYGIRVDNADVYMGVRIEMPPGSGNYIMITKGQNDIDDNTGKDVYLTNNALLVAYYNYWGSDYSVTSTVTGGSLFDFAIDPIPDPIPGFNKAGPDAGGQMAEVASVGALSAYQQKRNQLRDLAKQGEFPELLASQSIREVTGSEAMALTLREQMKLQVYQTMLRFRFGNSRAEAQALSLLGRVALYPDLQASILEVLVRHALTMTNNTQQAWQYFGQLSALDVEEDILAELQEALEAASKQATDTPEADPIVEQIVETTRVAVSPNPFNPTTQIAVTLAASSQVQLGVFDLLGRRVATLANGKLSAGSHQFTFDGAQLATGVYLYHLSINGRVQTGKMTLLK